MTQIDQMKITRGGKTLRVWNVKMNRWYRFKLWFRRVILRQKIWSFYFDDPITINQDQSLKIEVHSDTTSQKTFTLVGSVVEPEDKNRRIDPGKSFTTVYGIREDDKIHR